MNHRRDRTLPAILPDVEGPQQLATQQRGLPARGEHHSYATTHHVRIHITEPPRGHTCSERYLSSQKSAFSRGASLRTIDADANDAAASSLSRGPPLPSKDRATLSTISRIAERNPSPIPSPAANEVEASSTLPRADSVSSSSADHGLPIMRAVVKLENFPSSNWKIS